MKGVILAGGEGTRLRPLTLITNKNLLPVYDRPMILYPLETLKQAGITEILIVAGKSHAGQFVNFLGSGEDHGVKLSYAVQAHPGGPAHALASAEGFAKDGKFALIFGDNIYEDDFSEHVARFESMSGAMIFLKEVPDPRRFGVAEVKDDKIVSIEEKPKEPKSNLAATGMYLYDGDVFEKIRTLKPSWRGELEITDLQNHYLKEDRLAYATVKGFWSDAGTIESLLTVSIWAAEQRKKEGGANAK